MLYNKTFVDMTVQYSSCDRKPPYFFAHHIRFFMLTQEPEVTIYNGIHIQTISGHPLFVTPIACWLLGNQVPVRWALILHPGQGFTDSILKEIMFTHCFSEYDFLQDAVRK